MKHPMLLLMLFAIGNAQEYLDVKRSDLYRRGIAGSFLSRRGYEGDLRPRFATPTLQRRGPCMSKKDCHSPSPSTHSSKAQEEAAERRYRANRIAIEQARKADHQPPINSHLQNHPIDTIREEPSRSSLPTTNSRGSPFQRKSPTGPGRTPGLQTPSSPNNPRLQTQNTPPALSRTAGHVIPDSTFAQPSTSQAGPSTSNDPRTFPSTGKPPSAYHRRYNGSSPRTNNGSGVPRDTRTPTGSSPKKGEISPGNSSHLTATAVDLVNLNTQPSSGEASDSSSRKVQQWLDKHSSDGSEGKNSRGKASGSGSGSGSRSRTGNGDSKGSQQEPAKRE